MLQNQIGRSQRLSFCLFCLEIILFNDIIFSSATRFFRLAGIRWSSYFSSWWVSFAAFSLSKPRVLDRASIFPVEFLSASPRRLHRRSSDQFYSRTRFHLLLLPLLFRRISSSFLSVLFFARERISGWSVNPRFSLHRDTKWGKSRKRWQSAKRRGERRFCAEGKVSNLENYLITRLSNFRSWSIR